MYAVVLVQPIILMSNIYIVYRAGISLLGGDGNNDNNGGGGDGGGGNVYNPPPAPGFSSFDDFVPGPSKIYPPPL